MSETIKIPKKLIEVVLPLDDINAACAYEKMPGIGPHPRGIHLWWARRPLAAARAVIFAQMVNDPGYQQGDGFKFGVNKKQASIEREKLFDIMRDLVKWENTNNIEVLARAQDAINMSWREICELNKDHPQAAELFDPEKLPALHDPFAGGGAIPLEAQRLGLESYASDLNPVAVMINKAMLEIPPKFVGQKPVGPIPMKEKQTNLLDEWLGIAGLAEDVRRYGHWMHEEATKRLGEFYPKVAITPKVIDGRPDLEKYRDKELTVIAWLWARTVKSPNPAFNHVKVPLVSSFVLSRKSGKIAYVQPVVDGSAYEFEIGTGESQNLDELKRGTKLAGANFRCLLSDSPIEASYIRAEAQAGRLATRLMAIVAQGSRERVYLPPSLDMEKLANQADPKWRPEVEFFDKALGFRIGNYGFRTWADLFTSRQLLALTTFSDLIQEVRTKAILDAENAGLVDDGIGLDAGGSGGTAYADAMTVYLTFCVDRCADFNNSLTGWRSGNEKIMYLFSKQTISMVWDYGEANILANVVGSFLTNLEYQVKCLLKLGGDGALGFAFQEDAATQKSSTNKVVSTDPPYYDNIGYADLSDFFYVWMRRSLRNIYPSIFGTLVVPKAEELVATPSRHGGRELAETFFMDGMMRAIHNLEEQAHPAYPVSIYYAFKQSETKEQGTASIGWEIFLEAVINAGFVITGIWRLRNEQTHRVRALGANALASSIVLVCQKRPARPGSISRREFQRHLREEMPEALEAMIGGSEGASPIAPVDMAQAAIGPGIGMFSKFEAVLNQDGSKMSVHDALILINRAITDYLNPDSGNFDNDTLFCDSWFAEYGWSIGEFGQANVLAQAKGTTVDGVRDAGVIESGGNKVRLLRWREYPTDWDPKKDNRTPVWEAVHHMIRALNQQGESGAGELLAGMPERGESIRQLAYHLYTSCERKKWAEDARAYNELITSWHAIVAASSEVGQHGTQVQLELDA